MKIFKQITASNILLEPYPFLRELSMEAYLIENEAILKLDNEEYANPSIIGVEIPLVNGVSKKDGRLDIFAQYDDSYAIVELKKEEINHDTIEQLKQYLDKKGQLKIEDNESANWIGVVVGTEISEELKKALVDGLTYNGIPIGGIVLNRFKNIKTGEIFVISDTYFKNKRSESKDRAKYKFNGKEYLKTPLVLAVIKDYVENNPTITYFDLQSKFKLPDDKKCFVEISKAMENYNTTGYKRYYIDPVQQILLGNGTTIAVSNQWNKNNIPEFIKVAKNLGLNIK